MHGFRPGSDTPDIDFLAYDALFTGGVFVASGDYNGDGRADIVTGADAGGLPHVRVFDGATLAPVGNFLAYAPQFAGGVRVGAQDFTGDGLQDLVTGTGAGSACMASFFRGGSAQADGSITPFGTGFTGGCFVASQVNAIAVFRDGYE